MIERLLVHLYCRPGERIYFAWINRCWACLKDPLH